MSDDAFDRFVSGLDSARGERPSPDPVVSEEMVSAGIQGFMAEIQRHWEETASQRSFDMPRPEADEEFVRDMRPFIESALTAALKVRTGK